MSNLMTNIRRVSLPLQESSQHLGRLLLALGQAADSTLDAESLAALDKSAAAAAAATASGDSKTAASSTASAAAGEEDPQTAPPSRLEGEHVQQESFGPAAESAESREARSTTVSMTELLDDPSNHGGSLPASTAAAAAAAASGDSSSNLNKTTPNYTLSFSSTTPLVRASSSSVHSASSSSSFHGRTRASSSSTPASTHTPQQQQRPAASAESTPPDSAAAVAASGATAASPASPEMPRKPSPERPVAWRGFGSEEDDGKLVVCESRALAHLFTRVRNRETPSRSFNFYARRMARILAEEGIASLESSRQFITTPTAATFSSVFVDENNVCIVSVLRAGDALAEAAQACIPHAPVGKILIQRDEESRDKHPVLFYKKFPPKIASMQVLLCDPMLATGGSALMAIRCLVEAEVKESAIVFVSVVVCPEGLGAVRAEFPQVTIVTGAVDDCLDERRYILPGLGDFGDRFFGTAP